MFRYTSRLSIIALILGLLLVTPLTALAGGGHLRAGEIGFTEKIDYVGGHRSYLDEEEPVADFADLDRLSLIEQLVLDGELTVEKIQFIEDNVFELETVAQFEGLPTAYERIKAMYGTDHVTTEMIHFYEANVWN